MKIDTFRRVDISNNCTSRGLFKPGDKTVTGLRETCADDWQYGDITTKTKDGKKKKSLAIFRQTGYIGSVGGYIPQQFRKVVVERNGSYFVVTLYALGLHVTDGDLSKIAELAMVDISLFDNVTASMQIP